MASSKFNLFNQKDFVYKTINNHAISTTILIPKTLQTGKQPILVHFHGGFLICGDKMYEEWWGTWLIQFALSKNAIIVSPNYRLLPEASGKDVLSDIKDFWTWLHGSLGAAVESLAMEVQPDFERTLVAGESAGGYLAVQSALLHPEARISAVISQYGMLDNTLPHFTKPGEKYMAGAPQQPESEVDEYLRDMKPGDVRSSTHPWELWLFICATVQHGRYLKFLGESKELHPINNLDNAKSVPPIWVIHGKDDSLVSQYTPL